MQFVDPDTGIIGDFTIVSRAGKSTGAYANWRNVHNVETDVLKSINFDSVQEWKYIDTEQTMSVQSDNNNEILVAKTQELENWKQFSVYEEVEDEGQNTISVRWVLSEKVKDGNISIKARLVARGFEEDTSEINKRSPTCAKEFLRLANCISVSNKWAISSLDVKAAFLQGYNIEREVYLRPPKEAGTDKLWRLRKTVYGLSDAPLSWYTKVCDALIELGMERSMYDEAFFYCKVGDTLQGLVCCHVDDFFCTGSDMFIICQN